MEDSAAQCLGWELKHRPTSPCVAVPGNRRVDASRRRGVWIRYVDLDPDAVNGLATSAVATVTRSAARMPFDEAPALADSPQRQGHVTQEARVHRAGRMPGRYRSRCLRVAELADGRAAKPFESVLRAIATDCERYNALVVAAGGAPIPWEHVLFEPDEVRAVLTACVQGPSRRAVDDAMLRRSA